jgi:hypothetical protein
MVALLLVLALASGGPVQRPKPAVTPGVVRALSLKTVCETRWGVDRRKVTVGMKQRVAAAYGVRWTDRSRYEFDHLIPRSLGGADDERNLWVQPWEGTWNARMKDRLEVALGKQVCDGEMTLAFAQEAIRSDWIAAYRLYVRDAAPAKR